MSDIIGLIDAWNAGADTFEPGELLADAKSEIERLRSERSEEIARLQDLNIAHRKEIERLRVEEANLQQHILELEDLDRNFADMQAARDAEIERLRELLRSEGANRYWEARWRDADAELAAEREQCAISDDDLHYLRSILGHLREIRSALADGPSLGGEVLADNIDWLDCFIGKHQRAAIRRSE